MRRERTSLVTASVLLLVAAVGFAAKGGSSQVPASATFADRTLVPDGIDDRIRSDGLGAYNDLGMGDPCLTAWVDSASGQFFFRTASRTCNREMILDFSDALSRQAGCNCSPGPGPSPAGPCRVDDAFNQAGDIDLCFANTVKDVRWIAGNLFGSSALSAGIPLTLRINLEPNFEKTAFELQFEQSVTVAGDATTRVMSSDSTRVAELYKYTGKGSNKLSLGRFRMPFELTVTK